MVHAWRVFLPLGHVNDVELASAAPCLGRTTCSLRDIETMYLRDGR